MLKNNRTYQYYKNEWQWFTEPHEFDDFKTGFEALRITVDAAFDVFCLWNKVRMYDWYTCTKDQLKMHHHEEDLVDELIGTARKAIDSDIFALARCISRETGMPYLDCIKDVESWYRDAYDRRFGRVA